MRSHYVLKNPLSTLFPAALLIASCGDRVEEEAPLAESPASEAPSVSPAPGVEGGWRAASRAEGGGLTLLAEGGTRLRLSCPSPGRLEVNVPAFRPVGSEERMTFGSGGTVATLVADPRGDPRRGGVTASGEAPAELGAMLAGPIAVNYGAQNSGPHPSVPAAMARDFVAGCRGSAPPSEPAPAPDERISACLLQDGQRLDVAPLRAVGTEPFWGARIEGRCVTYSHPDDQAGTRVWTRYTALAGGGGRWAGALGGSRFELEARPRAGCSDGMSDRRYPMEVELLVGGERRRGCAAPA